MLTCSAFPWGTILGRIFPRMHPLRWSQAPHLPKTQASQSQWLREVWELLWDSKARQSPGLYRLRGEEMDLRRYPLHLSPLSSECPAIQLVDSSHSISHRAWASLFPTTFTWFGHEVLPWCAAVTALKVSPLPSSFYIHHAVRFSLITVLILQLQGPPIFSPFPFFIFHVLVPNSLYSHFLLCTEKPPHPHLCLLKFS